MIGAQAKASFDDPQLEISRVDNEIEIEINKVAEGIYAIRPPKPLPDDEYGLVQVPKRADKSAQPGFAPPI